MSSMSTPVCHVFHDLIHYNSASVDSEVTCSNFQMMDFIVEQESFNNVSQGLNERRKLPVRKPSKPY